MVYTFRVVYIEYKPEKFILNLFREFRGCGAEEEFIENEKTASPCIAGLSSYPAIRFPRNVLK